MSWFKVDDKLWGHPKWLATPARARGLWVTAGSWAAANETDGKIPTHVLPILGGRPADASCLVTAGLWSATRAGWTFHDWAVFQPDAASQRAKRDAESVAGGFGNHRRWHEGRGIVVRDCEHCNAPHDPSGTRSGGRIGGESGQGDSGANPPDPYPTRPDPIPDTSARLRVVGDGDQVQTVTYVTRDAATFGLGVESR